MIEANDPAGEPTTYFAPARRTSGNQLRQEIEFVSRNPVVHGLLLTVSGVLAVLDENRQILAANQAMLDSLGVPNREEALGLRPGEAIGCIHADDMEAGCGTSRFCSSCGAAIAIVTSLHSDAPVETRCAITVERDGKQADLCLAARCQPITVGDRRFLLLFLRDCSAEQHRAALERVFFHDMGNISASLMANCELIQRQAQGGDTRETAARILRLAGRMSRELKIQHLLSGEASRLSPEWEEATLQQVVEEAERTFSIHPSARGKQLTCEILGAQQSFSTDLSLLHRVLDNMLTNAFEATPTGGEVRLTVSSSARSTTFSVWNRQAVSPEAKLRMFQRNFSTKGGAGRGLGSFAMKLLGEEYLGGQVDFESSAAAGTVFRFTLPSARVMPAAVE